MSREANGQQRLLAWENRLLLAERRLADIEFRLTEVGNDLHESDRGAAQWSTWVPPPPPGTTTYSGSFLGCGGIVLGAVGTVTFQPSRSGVGPYGTPRVLTLGTSGDWSFTDGSTPGTVDGFTANAFVVTALTVSGSPWVAPSIAKTTALPTANNYQLVPTSAYTCWSPLGPGAWKVPTLLDDAWRTGTSMLDSAASGGGLNFPHWSSGPYLNHDPSGSTISCWAWNNGSLSYTSQLGHPVYVYLLDTSTQALSVWAWKMDNPGARFMTSDVGSGGAFFTPDSPPNVTPGGTGTYPGNQPGIVSEVAASFVDTASPRKRVYTFAGGGLAASLGITTVTIKPTP